MKKLQKHLQIQKTTIKSLAHNLGAATEDLAQSRKNAGPRGKWTAHNKINDAQAYIKAQSKAQEIGDYLRAIMPKEWDMGDWGVSFPKKGDSLRWCGKQGRAKGGVTTQPDTPSLIYMLTYLTAIANLGVRRERDHTHRIKRAGLEPREHHTFEINLNRNEHPAQHMWSNSRTPNEALAQLAATGEAFFSLTLPQTRHRMSTAEIFEQAALDARRWCLDESRGWTLMPTLWSNIYKHPIVKRLDGRHGTIESHHSHNWRKAREVDIEKVEYVCGRVMALANSLENKPQKKQDFLIQESDSFCSTVSAWCPDSAVLVWMLDKLRDGKYRNLINGPQGAYPLAQNGGVKSLKLMNLSET